MVMNIRDKFKNIIVLLVLSPYYMHRGDFLNHRSHLNKKEKKDNIFVKVNGVYQHTKQDEDDY